MKLCSNAMWFTSGKRENKNETVEQLLTLQSFLTNTVPCPGYIVDEQK